MGEPKTTYFYDFGIFEPVTKPQNQLSLSLETPGHLTKKQEKSKTFPQSEVGGCVQTGKSYWVLRA